MFSRSSGVLLHVSSLPGPFGIGDLGPTALDWMDWLAGAGCKYWQMLPLGPTGFGNSPYASPSSFAGNVDLISPQLLARDGLIDMPTPFGGADRVDFEGVSRFKWNLVEEAEARQSAAVRESYDEFFDREREWLEPYSLFMALKEAHDGSSWVDWDRELRVRDRSALAEARRAQRDAIRRRAFGQFLFDRQLSGLRVGARERGVQLIGDMPLYAATDSVDVWMRPELFAVDVESGRPTRIAGVPPDLFSPIGQVWGMPTYRWSEHAAEGFSWWIGRIGAFLRRADVLRLDHFTGFHRFYAIDPHGADRMEGEWDEGPGMALFDALADELGDVAMIVEDLGPLLPEVERFRKELDRPGIRILQEAFDNDYDQSRLPQNFPLDCVVYTGTHDNQTAQGRIETESPRYVERALQFTGGTKETFAPDLVQRAWESRQFMAVAPMQDILGLGAEARMNTPGTTAGNWEWRMEPGSADSDVGARLASLNEKTQRDG